MNNWIIAVAVGISMLIIGHKKIKPVALIRGLRNHNPGNLRAPKKDYWDGQIDRDSSGFAVFESPEWGIRALGKLLLNYQALYSINNVNDIINRYAPPNENNTGAYVQAVADELGVYTWWPIDVQSRLPQLVKAIIKHENGIQPYSDALIDRGLAMIETTATT